MNLSVSLDKWVCQMNQFEDRKTPALSFKSPLKEQALISAGSRQVTELIPVFRFFCCMSDAVILVVAGTAWEMQYPFPLLICQHNFFRLGVPVERNPPIVSISPVHHDKSGATFASPALHSARLSPSLRITHHWHAASLPSQNTRRTCWGVCGQMTWQLFPPPGPSEPRCHL